MSMSLSAVQSTNSQITAEAPISILLKSINLDPIPFIARRYKENTRDEVERIKGLNIVYMQFFIKYCEGRESIHLPFLHALELANELMANGYYVFTHGQGFKASFFTDLVTKAWQVHQPDAVLHPFHRYWRLPGVGVPFKNVNEYRKSSMCFHDDHDNRNTLLSVDGLLSSTRQCESAWAYYHDHTNQWGNNPNEVYRITQELSRYWLDDEDEATQAKFESKIASSLESIYRIYYKPNRWNFGRINVIAIPKNLLQDENTCLAYVSHPYGKECTCQPLDHQLFINTLEKHQEGVSSECPFPQYRLLTHALNTYQDILTFPFDNLPVNEKRQYDAFMDDILNYKTCLKLNGVLNRLK